MQAFYPKHIYVDAKALEDGITQRILKKFLRTPYEILENISTLKKPWALTEAKKRLVLTHYQGEVVKPCQGMGGYVCCNYLTVALVSNCHLECSYCILQDYLKNNPVITVYTNLETILGKIGDFLQENREKHWRLGTGELSDSLALDAITGFSKDLVSFAAQQPNLILELKTKSNQIENLLYLDHKRKTVVSWSLNPQAYIDLEEHKCSSLMERLEAARKIADCGYPIGFHFDPLLAFDRWKEEYANLFFLLKKYFSSQEIAWISMGSLRYTPGLHTVIKERWPSSRLLYGELFPSKDGKIRYFRGLREEIYQHVRGLIDQHFPGVSHYLCMETPVVWKNVYQQVPQSREELERHLLQ